MADNLVASYSSMSGGGLECMGAAVCPDVIMAVLGAAFAIFFLATYRAITMTKRRRRKRRSLSVEANNATSSLNHLGTTTHCSESTNNGSR